MRMTLRIAGILLVALLAAETLAGDGIASRILHPPRRALTPEMMARADEAFKRANATREDFVVAAPDGAKLKGWKVRSRHPNGDWVLLFHGVSDNRVGMLGQAEMLLRHGYSVVMMDARGSGESEGAIVTYGWLERNDTRAIVAALTATEALPASANIFASGESMGAAEALQSAGVEPRIGAVVAESAFRTMREVSFDYAGLRMSPLLGKTLLRPIAIVGLHEAEKEGGFRAEDVSPEQAVATRAFAVLLICGLDDHNIPARHTRAIYAAAIGPKEMWLVPGAGHTQVQGRAPEEFERRVIAFFARAHADTASHAGNSSPTR